LTAGCTTAPTDGPLRLEGNRLTVDNRTAQEWRGVEIWMNTYYRVTTPSIAAGARFEAPLDVFVAGFGQRFNVRSTPIHDLRLTATLPDGAPLELKAAFEGDRLSDALKGVGGRR
jgi:hypothetical protein